MQKSAFEVLIASRQYNVLIDKIGKVMDQEDNVRIYRLNSSNEVLLLGTSMTIYEDEVIIV